MLCIGCFKLLTEACIKSVAWDNQGLGSNPLSPPTNDTRAKHIFSSEGVRYNARRISWRWAVLWSTAHCQDNSLAAVDDPLSRKKNDPQKRVVLVGLPGFEPRMTGPESVVLPLHHSPIFVFDDAKVELIFWFAKKIAIFFHIFVKIFWQKTNKKYKTHWLWRV